MLVSRLEHGDLRTSLAILVRALDVLGLEEDLDLIARDDELGHRIQDVRQPRPRRSPRNGNQDG